MGAALGKDPKDVALARATEFRKRREKLDHILKSKPVHDRVPGSIFWQLTLRDAYTHFIPLGNEFSGVIADMLDFRVMYKSRRCRCAAFDTLAAGQNYTSDRSQIASRMQHAL